MGTEKIAGKPSTIIGTQNTNLVLRGQAIKIQYGNKFIDLIKDGKICSNQSNSSVIQSQTESKFQELDGSIILSLQDQNLNLSDLTDKRYVSYLQQSVGQDDKIQALKNLGFYYDSVIDIDPNFIGIAYVLNDNKFYQVQNGVVAEYVFNSTAKSEFTELKSENIISNNIQLENSNISSTNDFLYISSNKLKIGNYFTLDEVITAHKSIVLDSYIQSQDYDFENNKGYKLYIDDSGKSILHIDKVITREESQPKIEASEYITISNKDNVVQEIVVETENNTNQQEPVTEILLKNFNNYEVGDVVGIVELLIPNLIINVIEVDSVEEEPNEGTKPKLINTDIQLELNHVSPDNITFYIQYKKPYQMDVFEDRLEIKKGESKATITIIGEVENVIISNTSYDTYVNVCNITKVTENTITVDQVLGNAILGQKVFVINSGYYIDIKNGNLQLFENNTLVNKIGEINENDVINNQLDDPTTGLYSSNFIGTNSKLYDPVFKTKTNSFPKYDNIELPEDVNSNAYNDVIPNVEWVKSLVNNFIPKGTITMFHGTEIPTGWAICDGNNGTPNLIGKFIKAGEEESSGTYSKDVTLGINHLPSHSHSIPALTTNTVSGHTHVLSKALVNPNDTVAPGDYNFALIDGTTTSSGQHSHTINANTTGPVGNGSSFNTVSLEYYSLVFIMKIV